MHDDPAPRLRALLQQRCSVADMRTLVRDLPGELELHLPEGPVRPAEFASELVLLLRRHHALDATFFRALLALRPRLRAEILALAADHGCTELAGIPADHAPELAPRTNAPRTNDPRRRLGALAVLPVLTGAALLAWPLVRPSEPPLQLPLLPLPAAEHDDPSDAPQASPSPPEASAPATARSSRPDTRPRSLDPCARLKQATRSELGKCAETDGLSLSEATVDVAFTPGSSRVTLPRRPDEPTFVACIEKAIESAAEAMPPEPTKKKYTCTLSP